jgi:hypothetical protein
MTHQARPEPSIRALTPLHLTTMTFIESHQLGQTWHPIKNDTRYKISLTFCGYSVPMYCCWFCDDELIGAARQLDRAVHACETIKSERR